MEFNPGQKNSNGAPRVAAPRFPSGGTGGMGSMDMNGDGNKKVAIIGVIVITLLVVGVLGWWAMGKMGGSQSQVKGDKYQALFLSNGQVYFGKLSNVDDKYVKLTEIYYLQVQQVVQPADKSKEQSPQVSLAKLGSELHGPEDQMEINRDQVLFWENLKDDSKVVDAIKKNQK